MTARDGESVHRRVSGDGKNTIHGKKTDFGVTELSLWCPVLAVGGVARSTTRDNNEENQLNQMGRDVIKGRFRGVVFLSGIVL